jgi:hypothetical protein
MKQCGSMNFFWQQIGMKGRWKISVMLSPIATYMIKFLWPSVDLQEQTKWKKECEGETR